MGNTALPTCVAITCPAFTAPANGAVSCSDSVNFGSVCTFTCNAGYAVNGALTSTCGAGAGTSATGSFDAVAPTWGDVNECADATLNNCDVNAACTDTVGSYTCTCNTGYTGDGFTCTDINECADPALNNCGANAICTNTVGSYSCACAVGYTGDGITCVDINECALTPAVCDVNAICLNVEGSYSCNCNAGYTGTGIPGDCVDINECTSGATACSANAVCSNTIGSFTCACATGYERQSGDGGPPAPESLICVDINGCTRGTDNCNDVTGVCTNTEGSFTCSCIAGYQGDGITCTDINECLADPGPCRPLATCTNTVGSFVCNCGSGFCGDGITSCLDVDECSDSDANECAVNARCDNLPGSYDCTCSVGFSGDGRTSCEPAGLQPGEIATIVVSSIIALGLFILLIVYLVRRN